MVEVLERTRQYFAALEADATGESLAGFYAPEVVQEEFPNRLAPRGATWRPSSTPRSAGGR